MLDFIKNNLKILILIFVIILIVLYNVIFGFAQINKKKKKRKMIKRQYYVNKSGKEKSYQEEKKNKIKIHKKRIIFAKKKVSENIDDITKENKVETMKENQKNLLAKQNKEIKERIIKFKNGLSDCIKIQIPKTGYKDYKAIQYNLKEGRYKAQALIRIRFTISIGKYKKKKININTSTYYSSNYKRNWNNSPENENLYLAGNNNDNLKYDNWFLIILKECSIPFQIGIYHRYEGWRLFYKIIDDKNEIFEDLYDNKINNLLDLPYDKNNKKFLTAPSPLPSDDYYLK